MIIASLLDQSIKLGNEKEEIMTLEQLPVGTRVTNRDDDGIVVAHTIFRDAVRIKWDAGFEMHTLIAALHPIMKG